MRKLEQLILSHLDTPNVIFVFPTQISARQWAEHILEILPDGSGTVAMDRFLAWDSFKGESIKSSKEHLISIPSVLRQMFAASFIGKNASSEPPLFSYLIPEEYRTSAGNFTAWIAALLPQLHYWAEHRLINGQLPSDADSEDTDLFTLYTAYSLFLDEHSLFDPAWEKPPFISRNGEHYFVLYPDALSDFDDYRALLTDEETRKTVTLVYRCDLEDDPADGGEKQQTVFSYTNSRTELRLLALQLRKAHYEDGIAWHQMAVSIADTDTYGPYLTRELELYDIPYQYRVGKPLASRGAGLLFSQLQECVEQKFSYETVKNLLTNPALPWKAPEAVEQLIAFGQKNCCICAWERNGKTVDPWKDAFKDAAGAELEVRAKALYDKLKSLSENLVRSTTFADIKKHYFAFREELFDTEKFSEDDDRVLGRCISELANLMEVEAEYPDVSLPAAYSFFCKVLKDTVYVPQAQEKRGVHIYEYKAAAAAPFCRHFILDASQSSLQVTFNRLLFLRSEKRDRMNIAETDASREYIAMYAQNSTLPAVFSCSEKTFGSYSIPHSSFAVHGDDLPKDQRKKLLDHEQEIWNAQDPYLCEKAWFKNESGENTSDTHFNATMLQTRGFNNWAAQQSGTPETSDTPQNSGWTAETIRNRFTSDGYLNISQSAVADYRKCPRLWFFSRVVKLQEQTLSASLMEDTFKGTELHSMLENFFNSFGNNVLLPWDDTTNDTYTGYLNAAMDKTYEKLAAETRTSPLTKELVKSQREGNRDILKDAITAILKTYAGYTVYATEKYLSYNRTTESDSPVPYRIGGYIDLILLNPDLTGVVLIDYKSNSIPTIVSTKINPDTGELKTIQFAIYKLLFDQNSNPENPLTVEKCSYVSIKGHKVTTVYNQAEDDWTAELETARSYADSLADDICQGTFRAYSKIDRTTCSGCDYKHICRTNFRIGHGYRPVYDMQDAFFTGDN